MRSVFKLFAAALALMLIAGRWPADADAAEYIWRASTGGKIRGRPVATRDGTVYVLSEDRHLYALEESSGRVVWRTFLGGRVWDSLCIGADGTIYTALKDGDLIAVARGGGVAWKFKAAGLPVGNPAAVDDGTIYFALDNGYLYAVSHTGRERWRVRLRAPPVTGPAVGTTGDIYIASADNRVLAYHPRGEAYWNAILAGAPTEPAIAGDGTVYYGTDYGSVVALDQTGDILWDYVSDAGFLSPVLAEGRVLAATINGEIIALDSAGQVLWQSQAAEGLTGYLTATAGKDLIALSKNGYLVRFRDDGHPVDKLDVRGSGSLFGVSPTGKYIFGGDDWLVYAYQWSLPGGDTWSQPGANPQHTSSALTRSGSDSWLETYRDNADFLILDQMVHNKDPEMKEMALYEITRGLSTTAVVPPYYEYFLSDLASEGTLRAEIEYGRVINDFPEIRSSAVELLGEIGTLRSSNLLVQLLRYEYDSAVQKKMIAALGALMTDKNGDATAAISQVVLKDLHGKESPNPRLAETALLALEAIRRYNGLMPNRSGSDLLFEIYRGAYPREIRELALKLMRGAKM